MGGLGSKHDSPEAQAFMN